MDEKNILKKANAFEVIKDKNIVKFVSVGSLFPVKGYDLLILSASKLKKKKLNFKIDIYGKGFLKNKLNKLIKKYNLKDHVEIKGFVKNPYPFLRNADVFIMSSKSEAMPMALCEAIILGKPTLVNDCSGSREVINYGENGLMSKSNINDFSANMLKLIEDEDFREKLSLKSTERALLFSDKRIMNQIVGIIK